MHACSINMPSLIAIWLLVSSSESTAKSPSHVHSLGSDSVSDSRESQENMQSFSQTDDILGPYITKR